VFNDFLKKVQYFLKKYDFIPKMLIKAKQNIAVIFKEVEKSANV
jgi:hypothetical protein